MGGVELLLIAFLTFGLGYSIGPSDSPEDEEQGKKKEQQVRPDRWSPSEHSDFLRTCGIICGKDNVKSYDSLRGQCECK